VVLHYSQIEKVIFALMRSAKVPLFLAALLFLAFSICSAQTRKSKRSSGYRTHSMSRAKARITCPIFEPSQYPYQGIGIKLGDPFAVSYKFYPNKHWAFAVDAGKAASGLYSRYYRDLFNGFLPDTLEGVEKNRYLAHKATKDLFIEAKFLYQWNAEKISEGLQFYVGGGWQWRSTTLEYDYIFENGPFDSQLNKFTERRSTYGPVALAGIEYSYFSIPISAFIEVEWFTDVLLDPGYQRFQGGIGLRYVF
jgi:hypothetical protein